MGHPRIIIAILILAAFSCKKDDSDGASEKQASYPAIRTEFALTIDPDNLYDYEAQVVPPYITRDNAGANPVTNAGATLGRVLFYDPKLSSNNQISCSSCHQQQFAFSDSEVLSTGVNGKTNRHSMRLINARFSQEVRFFWDERASSLEEQTTIPIQDHLEMGYSGTHGDDDINDLILKLKNIAYYPELFELAFGSEKITEQKIQIALSQFVRSIQSFDSKYDEGRSQVTGNAQPFPNFTADENAGKNLFMTPPNAGGAGCAGCHRPPEFDIDPNSRNNNIVGNAKDSSQLDLFVFRAPSLRDLVGPNGTNGPMMHDGSLTNLREVVNHYNRILPEATNDQLDFRLQGPNGQGQSLQLTETEKNQLESFLMTLSGKDIYTNPMFSDPF